MHPVHVGFPGASERRPRLAHMVRGAMEVGTGTERSGLVDNSVVELTSQNDSKATHPSPTRHRLKPLHSLAKQLRLADKPVFRRLAKSQKSGRASGPEAHLDAPTRPDHQGIVA